SSLLDGSFGGGWNAVDGGLFLDFEHLTVGIDNEVTSLTADQRFNFVNRLPIFGFLNQGLDGGAFGFVLNSFLDGWREVLHLDLLFGGGDKQGKSCQSGDCSHDSSHMGRLARESENCLKDGAAEGQLFSTIEKQAPEPGALAT